MDILDRIDQATGCQQCQGHLGGSPSDDFCSEGCQAIWAAARSHRLEGYTETRLVTGETTAPTDWFTRDFSAYRQRWVMSVDPAAPDAEPVVACMRDVVSQRMVHGSGWEAIGTVEDPDLGPYRGVMVNFLARSAATLGIAPNLLGVVSLTSSPTAGTAQRSTSRTSARSSSTPRSGDRTNRPEVPPRVGVDNTLPGCHAPECHCRSV